MDNQLKSNGKGVSWRHSVWIFFKAQISAQFASFVDFLVTILLVKAFAVFYLYATFTGSVVGVTRAVAEAGYHIIMACYRPSKAEPIRQRLVNETGNANLEVMAVDLSSMASTASFADRIVERHLPVSLLMNNAGTMETGLHITDDGFERTVSVNYLGPYLLTRKLLPALTRGARVGSF